MKKLRLPEEMLIRLLQEQHPNGARALYDMYGTALMDVICRILKDEQMSEDILQDTLMKIWHSIHQYQPQKGRLFTWMINIARNMAIDCFRSKHYRNGQQTQGLEGCEELPQGNNEAYEKVDRQLIRQTVDRLRPTEANLVDLIYYRGYTQVEVSETLGIPLGTVKTRLTMAMKKLRGYYAERELALAS